MAINTIFTDTETVSVENRISTLVTHCTRALWLVQYKAAVFLVLVAWSVPNERRERKKKKKVQKKFLKAQKSRNFTATAAKQSVDRMQKGVAHVHTQCFRVNTIIYSL